MTQDYVEGVAYPPQFHREMTPPWIDAVLRGLGRQGPDFARPFRWCELGCGSGLNALILAATHPQAEVVAVDADASALAEARIAADAAALRNIVFLPLRFDQLRAGSLGFFDVIATHGVLSWIAPAQRSAMLNLIGAALRPGGVAYAHYMTHPGMSAAAAGQSLMLRYAAGQPGAARHRARASLNIMQSLADAGAGYFAAYPQERQRLQWAARQEDAALAHEVLPPNWQPFHVAEMMEAFAGSGCAYLGSATPPDNIDAVSLPAATRPLLAGVEDAALAESLRDMARNQSLRRDLYGKELAPMSADAHRTALHALRLAGLPGAPEAGRLRFDLPLGQVEGEAALFDPLLRALRNRPRRLGEMERPGLHPAMLNQAAQMLIWSECAHPVAAAPAPPQAAWALNRHLATRGGAGWLAAPALGGAVAADPAAMLGARIALEEPGLDDVALVERAAHLLDTEQSASRDLLADWAQKRRQVWVNFGVLPAA
ncbi:class I SAM-dependent methyltransferase [Pseudoroseomonas globiformis]|uniref:Class I SAM-dependent methyltransferase n=1 Tax=Teichococcus globiformis TaxID=2307229 RepID=A0ABV7FWK1_9PROT